MAIHYRKDIVPSATEIIEVYQSSGLNRPVDDPARIHRMFAEANLVVTAWEEARLVGVARSLTDYCYCCYLSDLAVHKEFQGRGIGKHLVQFTRDVIGEKTTLVLVSAPGAVEFYRGMGMDQIESGFIIKRKR
jgi:ribosomal protein S18 acetylase RimI-like enzyme